MKKHNFIQNVWTISLIFVLMLATGCSNYKEQPGKTDDTEYGYKIYCIDKEVSKLVSWGMDIDENAKDEDKLRDILNAFMSAPEDESKKSAMPEGLASLTYTLQMNVANVNLDSSYNALNSLEKLFFKAGLVLTITQIENIDYVYITVNGQPLMDEDGVPVRYLTKDSFILYEDGKLQAESDMYLKLYYINSTGDKLVAKDEVYTYDRSISPELYVLKCLNVDVNSAYTKNGICYVDLSSEMNGNDYVEGTPQAVLYSVVNSLTQLKGISGVKVTIEGRDDILFRGSISIENILSMNLDIMEK